MNTRRDTQITHAITLAAVRLLVEGHCDDYRIACRKAAEQLGERNQKRWPSPQAIEQALRDYQQLFRADSQADALQSLRRLALAAMQDFAHLSPRLVGPVARGVADRHSGIRLLMRAETPEDVALLLTNRHIPWHAAEVTLMFSRNRRMARPALRFQAGDTRMELVILPPSDRNDPPLDPADEKPMRGLSAAQLETLLMDDVPADQR